MLYGTTAVPVQRPFPHTAPMASRRPPSRARARPPDAYLQNPARARQERPIGQDRQPRTHAPLACLTIALTCILTGLTLSACSLPCAPPPARQSLPGSKRFTIQPYQHLTATLDPAPQKAQHRDDAQGGDSLSILDRPDPMDPWRSRGSHHDRARDDLHAQDRRRFQKDSR